MPALSVTQRGNGNPIILIHGFPMNQQIWNKFAPALATNFKVFTPDLPGFGKSEILPTPFSLEDVGKHLLAWIDEQQISNPVVVGHSLGGYVALAMVALKPEVFSGMTLFHSTAYADSAEKQEARNKTLEFIHKHGVEAFTSNFIQPLFAHKNHPAIQPVREICMQSSSTAVEHYTMAMRDRPDRLSVVKEFRKPMLFIGGEKDQVIPIDAMRQQASLNTGARLISIPDTGHMGMFENEVQTLEALTSFSRMCFAS